MEKIVQEIMKLKKERNAVILAHLYQPDEIQEIADFTGDSLELSRRAAQTDAAVIVFCGVHFMAETANILSPDKIVLLPDPDAGCGMADMIAADALAAKKAASPDAVVVAYVNTTAAVKALSDICCTSANAVQVVASVPADKEILFVPDRNLGAYAGAQAGRSVEVWPGFCPVHQGLRADAVAAAKRLHPEAEVLAHPECPPEVLALADYVGSTTGILRRARESAAAAFIVATECGVLRRLRQESPDKRFYLASPSLRCEEMKHTTLEKVRDALETLEPRVVVAKEIREKAVFSLEKMLEICR